MFNIELFSNLDSITKIDGKLPFGLFKLTTDSRIYCKGEIFLALNGQNFQGIDFISDAAMKGCQIIVCEDSENLNKIADFKKKFPKVSLIFVTDPLLFLHQLAKKHTASWKDKNKKRVIIGITGSNGKTTCKEMLFHQLNFLKPGKVLATEGNYNNHIGVPKTLLRLNGEIDMAIIEMGSNHPGEIKLLCDLVRPNAGLITNIGASHLEFFENISNVFLEKRTLFDTVMKNTQNKGPFVLDQDDIFLSKLPKLEEVIFYKQDISKEQTTTASYKFQKNNSVLIKYINGQEYSLNNKNIVGKHNFKNLIATFLLSHFLFPALGKKLELSVEEFKPKDNRSTWVEKNGKFFFLDAYNANPSSMKSSLCEIVDFFNFQNIDPSRQFYVLGDMNELGENSFLFHREIGTFIKDLNIENVAFIGQYSKHYKLGLDDDRCIMCVDKNEFVEQYWSTILQRYDYFFIKGSRSLKLETLFYKD